MNPAGGGFHWIVEIRPVPLRWIGYPSVHKQYYNLLLCLVPEQSSDIVDPFLDACALGLYISTLPFTIIYCSIIRFNVCRNCN